MMLSTISYQDLEDFSGLPIVREILAQRDTGFNINGLSRLVEQEKLDALVGLILAGRACIERVGLN